MPNDDRAVHFHVGSRGAEIRGRANAAARSSEQLNLDRDRELLVLSHGGRVLPVDHDAAVAIRPARTSRALVAREAIDHSNSIAVERDRVMQVSETSLEPIPARVVHSNDA